MDSSKDNTDKFQKKKKHSKNANQWKIFHDKGDLAFVQAYNHSRSMRACPEGLASFLVRQEPVARTEYNGQSGRSCFIFTYLIYYDYPGLIRAAKKQEKILSVHSSDSRCSQEDDFKFNICSQHIDLGSLSSVLVQSIRTDIRNFCKNIPSARHKELKHYSLIDIILPEPRFTMINANPKLIVKDGKGTFSDVCALDIGIDLSKGCVSNTSDSGIYDPGRKCAYCYAFQNGPCFLDTMYNIDEDSMVDWIKDKIQEKGIENKQIIYFRFGQTVDSNVPPLMRLIPGFKDNLKVALRALRRIAEERAVDYKEIRVAMPTKIVEYDSELAGLMKETNCSVLASIVDESLEQGIVGHGYSVDRRLEEVLKFGMAGVNANIYIATDITRGIDDMRPDAKKAFDFFQKHEQYLGLQFLDVRITKRSHAKIIGGREWDELIYTEQKNLFTDYQGKWCKGQYLHAWITHPDFLKITGDNQGNVRLCSTHVRPEERRCGMCFMDRKY